MTTGTVAPGACVAKNCVSCESTFTDVAAVVARCGSVARQRAKTAVIKSALFNIAVVSFFNIAVTPLPLDSPVRKFLERVLPTENSGQRGSCLARRAGRQVRKLFRVGPDWRRVSAKRVARPGRNS